MNCKTVQKKLPLYVGGELSDRLSGKIARHLEGCPSCQEQQASFVRARQALQQAATRPPRLNRRQYWANLQRRILESRWRHVPHRSSFQPTLRPLSVGIVSLLAIAIVVGAIVVYQHSTAPHKPDSRYASTPEAPPAIQEGRAATYQLELVSYTEPEEPIDL